MGIHLGEAVERDGDYFGPPVNLCARLMSAAHGGQIVVSAAAADLATGFELTVLGEIRLRDIDQPVGVRQVNAEGLGESFPALRGVDSGLSTLPQFRSSFIGRQVEIDRIRSLIASHRLVTVTGVGGAGKTRTAIEAAERELHRFAGVFFVDLSAVGDAAEVTGAVATGIELAVGGDPRPELIRYLSARDVLLVVDNCEHLLDPIAELLDELLDRCPRLTVVATSREALEMEGEETYRLPSLDPEDSALRLFVERATAANDRFELTPSNRATIVDLCRHLDGMPLAIELAASRARSLSPDELLAGLDDRFSLLRAGRRRGVLQRQRTLEAAIEWSYDLLEPDEQRFFRSLGAFAGPFLIELVPGTADVTRVEALDRLDSLVAKSLVSASVIEDGSTSYRLLETLRSFAIGRLADAGETEAVALRHRNALANAFGDVLGRDDASYDAHRQLRYRHQVADIFAAFDHAIASEEPIIAASLTTVGSLSLVGSAAASALTTRVEHLKAEWLDHLDLDWKARVLGELASAQMLAGDYAACVATATAGLEATAGADLMAQSVLNTIKLVMAGTLDPQAALEDAKALEVAYDEAGITGRARTGLDHTTLGTYVMNRDFDRAEQILALTNRGQIHHMVQAWRGWMTHLTGRKLPAPESVGFVPTGGWDFAGKIGQCMGSDRSLEEKARRLVTIADTHLHGRLPFEESEYLTALGRIALLSDDRDHAIELTDAVVGRTPWCTWAFSETVAQLEDWPPDEWLDRYQHLVATRLNPATIAERRDRAPHILRAELDRWR